MQLHYKTFGLMNGSCWLPISPQTSPKSSQQLSQHPVNTTGCSCTTPSIMKLSVWQQVLVVFVTRKWHNLLPQLALSHWSLIRADRGLKPLFLFPSRLHTHTHTHTYTHPHIHTHCTHTHTVHTHTHTYIYIREQYKGKTILPLHGNNGHANVPHIYSILHRLT